MPMPDHIAERVEKLDEAGQALVMLVWHMYEEQAAQIAKLQQMLFGSRSEKIPSVQSEVRRSLEYEELAPAELGLADDATDAEVAAAKTTARRKSGREQSEVRRQARKADLSKLPVVREQGTRPGAPSLARRRP